MTQTEEKGGFFDLIKEKTCNHSEHEPPTHLYIPPGKGYRHICPGCGEIKVITPLQISFGVGSKSNEHEKI